MAIIIGERARFVWPSELHPTNAQEQDIHAIAVAICNRRKRIRPRTLRQLMQDVDIKPSLSFHKGDGARTGICLANRKPVGKCPPFDARGIFYGDVWA